jgi:hypothetical protein
MLWLLRQARIAFFAMLAVATLAACAGTVPGPEVTSPFTAQDEQLFDDGIDLMEDPDALHGQWRQDWENELSGRFERSDAIVEGEVVAVHEDENPDKRVNYRLVIKIRKVHRGHLGPGVSEVALISREGAVGYGSIASNPQRILRRPFVAFMKYVEAPVRPFAHFHMTPPSIALRRGLATLPKQEE